MHFFFFFHKEVLELKTSFTDYQIKKNDFRVRNSQMPILKHAGKKKHSFSFPLIFFKSIPLMKITSLNNILQNHLCADKVREKMYVISK